MVFNPMSMLSQEQQAFLQEVQKFTKDIKAVVHKDGEGNFTLLLVTENPQAQQYLPQIRELMINSLAQSLYTLFGIAGEIE